MQPSVRFPVGCRSHEQPMLMYVQLARRLLAQPGHRPMGVLNEGLAGNRLLHDSLGPNALARFDREVLAQSGVTHVIVQTGATYSTLNPVEEVTVEQVMRKRRYHRGWPLYFICATSQRGIRRSRVTPAMAAGLADHVSSIEEIVGLLDRRPQVAACAREMMTDKQAESWMGFACKQCGAPLAIQRSDDASKSGQHSARGWRVTCTSCGSTEYYEPGTPMVRMTVSH